MIETGVFAMEAGVCGAATAELNTAGNSSLTPPLAVRNATNILRLKQLQNSPSAFARIRARQAIMW